MIISYSYSLTESTVHFISKLERVVMETDVLGCTINRPLARFVCCWAFFPPHKLSKVLVFSRVINVSTYLVSAFSLQFSFVFVIEGDGPTTPQ